MEHCELVDLQELVINRDTDVKEVPEQIISFPYYTKKERLFLAATILFLKR